MEIRHQWPGVFFACGGERDGVRRLGAGARGVRFRPSVTDGRDQIRAAPERAAGPPFHHTQKRVPCPSRVLCERAGFLADIAAAEHPIHTSSPPRAVQSDTSDPGRRKLGLGCPVPCGFFARGGCLRHDIAPTLLQNNAKSETLHLFEFMRKPLKSERHAAAYRSCRLHQVNGMPIAP